jgi:hypothetical protein
MAQLLRAIGRTVQERETSMEDLSKAVQRPGRSPKMSNQAKKDRDAVRNAIDRGMTTIEERIPKLGAHLRKYLKLKDLFFLRTR